MKNIQNKKQKKAKKSKKKQKKTKREKKFHKKKFFIDGNFLIVSTYGRAKILIQNFALF